jgi:hypothetical protein
MPLHGPCVRDAKPLTQLSSDVNEVNVDTFLGGKTRLASGSPAASGSVGRGSVDRAAARDRLRAGRPAAFARAGARVPARGGGRNHGHTGACAVRARLPRRPGAPALPPSRNTAPVIAAAVSSCFILCRRRCAVRPASRPRRPGRPSRGTGGAGRSVRRRKPSPPGTGT